MIWLFRHQSEEDGDYLEGAHYHQVEPVELRQEQDGDADETAARKTAHGRPQGGRLNGQAIPPHHVRPHADPAHKEGGQHEEAVGDVDPGLLQPHGAQDAAQRDERRGELHHEHVAVDAVSSATDVLPEGGKLRN